MNLKDIKSRLADQVSDWAYEEMDNAEGSYQKHFKADLWEVVYETLSDFHEQVHSSYQSLIDNAKPNDEDYR